MRKQIMDGLRMAGQKVRGFDDAYASKLAEYIGGFKPQQGGVMDNLQNVGLIASAVPATRMYDTGAVGNTMQSAKMLHNIVGYGVPALNAGVRYGVPAAGLIGVGHGLNALYDAASQVPVMANNPQ